MGGHEAKDFGAVKVYADKCREMYGAQAEEMQKALTAPPARIRPSNIGRSTTWALPSFLLGQALEKQGDNKGAIVASYKYVVEKTPLCAVLGSQGLVLEARADAAGARLKALEFDSME